MEDAYIIIFAVVLILLGLVRRFTGGALRRAPEQTVRAMLDGGARVVDIRSPEEFSQDHYPGALNIPLGEISGRYMEFGGTDDPVLIYCNTGSRSRLAIAQLRKRGYRNVINAGGLDHLRDAEKA